MTKKDVIKVFEQFLLMVVSFTGIFVGLGFLFLGLVNNNFLHVVFGLLSIFAGFVAATTLNIKYLNK